jgi:DNA-binding CsgD family transcriptional regulator
VRVRTTTRTRIATAAATADSRVRGRDEVREPRGDGRWPLVGREAELARLDEAIHAGRSAVIAGPAGAGKTTLAIRSLQTARDQGMAVMRTTATHSSRRLPFGALAPFLPGPDGHRTVGDDQGQLLSRYASAVADRACGHRLVVFADDAHLLDDGSATLVHQLALAGAGAVVAAVRTDAPAPDAVTAMWKDGLADRIEVGPLDEMPVEQLLLAVLGGPVDAASARHLMSRSQGNPMVLRELVAGALGTGALADSGGIWSLRRELQPTARLAELLAFRLGELSGPERTVLELLALSEPLGQAVLSSLTGRATVGTLERRQLIISRPAGRRVELWLAHPVYGDLVRAGISALRRQSLAGALAGAVEATGARRREDVLRLASLRFTGGGGSAGLFVAGAMAARERRDHSLTERLARAAVREGGGFQARLLAAEAAHCGGRHLEAGQELAALSAEAVSDAQRAKVTLVRFENDRYLPAGAGPGLIGEAAAAVTDPSWRQKLLDRRYAAMAMSRGPRAAVEAGPAVPQHPGAASSSVAHAALASSLVRLGRLGDAIELAGPCPAGAAPEPGLPWELSPFSARAGALIYAGRLGEAEEFLTAAADRPGQPPGAADLAAAWLAVLHLEQGRPASAFRRASGCYARVHQGRATPAAGLANAAVAQALALTGWASRAAAVLAASDVPPFRAAPVLSAEMLRARAWVAAAAGNFRSARTGLGAAAGRAEEAGDLVGATSALHDLARLGRAGDVCARISALASEVDGDLASARAAYARAVAARDHALLSRTARAFEDMGAKLYAAEARAEAAAILRRGGKAREATAAGRMAARLRACCEGAATPAVGGVTARAHLTPAELDVARQAAAGHSNKQIASDMQLSVRTVESHLLRAYQKLGISRRHDLAGALA